MNLSVIPATPENKLAMLSMITNMYKAEGCGVCEKPGAEVFWVSPYSRCAHTRCVNLIKAAESKLTKTIVETFKNNTDYRNHNNAHIQAIKAVRRACGSETILSYLEKNGLDNLTLLFNTVGIEAVKKYEIFTEVVKKYEFSRL